MDELEFRRRIMSDPKYRDSELTAAIKGSEANSKFADEILDLDNQIAKAMAVDVPVDLADRILFNQTSTAQEDKIIRPSFAKRAMAMAASIAFV
ncbi:chemotaxis protein, partial [Vibrio xuii]